MRVSYNDLISGEAIKIGQKIYSDTKSYVQPFLDIMSEFTNDFRYNVKEAETTSIDKNIYPRVLIEAISQHPNYREYKRIDCLTYGLDSIVPTWKVYTGFLNTKNGAFLSLGGGIIMDNITPNSKLDYDLIRDFVKKDINTHAIEFVNNIEIPYNEAHIAKMVGTWVAKIIKTSISNKSGKIMLPTDCVPKAYKLLYEDMNSAYYIPNGVTFTLFNIYDAFAFVIANNHRDLLNKFEKALLLEKILS